MTLHLAILRTAALFVPESQRTDWLAEWRAELWHVQRDPTAFCMGAFKDAFWILRNAPGTSAAPHLSSPSRCLALLAALGALCLAATLLLPGARNGLLYFPFPGSLVLLTPTGQASPLISRDRFDALKAREGSQFSVLAFCALAQGKCGLTSSEGRRLLGTDARSPVTAREWRNLPTEIIEEAPPPPAAGGYVLGRLRYPSLHSSEFRVIPLQKRSFEFLRLLATILSAGMILGFVTSSLTEGHPKTISMRRTLFLTAKTLLTVPIVAFGSMSLATLGSKSVTPLVVHLAFFGGLFAARWILADQRSRCPVCLRTLANPVRMGGPSRILLEWHGTELMCLRGHGLLYVPEWPAIWSGRQRWLDLGPSWGGLFP